MVVIVQRLWFHLGYWVGGLSFIPRWLWEFLTLSMWASPRGSSTCGSQFPLEWMIPKTEQPRQKPQCLWVIWTPKFQIITSTLFYLFGKRKEGNHINLTKKKLDISNIELTANKSDAKGQFSVDWSNSPLLILKVDGHCPN